MRRFNLLLITFCIGFHSVSIARDLDGKYAQRDPKMHEWFDNLRSSRGRCCSDADGTAVSDPDWDVKDGHYRVRLQNQWWDVPDDAVIKEPNRYGPTMVWPIYHWNGKILVSIYIQCFMPGAGS